MTSTIDGVSSSAPRFDRSLAQRLVVIALTATAAAAVPGMLFGYLTYGIVLDGNDTDGFAELGAAIFGVMIGLLVALIAYVVATLVATRRLIAPGRRPRPALAVLLAPPALAVIGSIPSSAMGLRSPAWVGLLASVTLIAATVVGLGAVGGAVASRTAMTLVVPLAAAGLALTAATAVAGDAADRDATRAAIERLGSLPLVDGERLDEPFPGWRLDEVRAGDRGRSVDVRWRVDGEGSSDAHLTINDQGYGVIVHTDGDRAYFEGALRQRMVMVPAARFIEACGRRC